MLDELKEPATTDRAEALGDFVLGRPASYDYDVADSSYLFEAAFESTSIGKILARPDGHVFAANQAMCDFLGYTKAEFGQLSIRDISYPQDFALDLANFRELLAGKVDRYQIEKRYIHKSGHQVWGQLYVAALRRPDGKLEYLLAEIQDITVMMEQRELLQQSNRLLASQNAHLEQLAHLASHNLRSPLANIQALANLYAMSSLSEREEHVQLIQESARRAMETLTQLFERLRQTKRLEQEQRRLSFAVVAQRVLQILESERRRAQAEIELDFAACPEIDYIPLYLESILLNLLSNALKFTVPGRPVRIRVTSGRQAQQSWLEVADNGSGIDLARHGGQLFSLYQAFSGREDSQGVGLYLVKTQLEACGGNMSVESEPNVGTTFRIRF